MNFSVHHQTYNNRKAVECVLESFRKHFPNENYRLISDNGADFSDMKHQYNIDFELKDKNTFPGGRFQTIQNCYDWLERVNETCELYDTEWIVLFEDDVITQNSEIHFPKEDSGGMPAHPWSSTLTNFLKKRNTKNKEWGYGMCGGSIFKRSAFLSCYEKIDKFDLESLNKMDERVTGFSDTLINVFLQYFGFSYEKWEGMDDMTIPGHQYSPSACFIHGNKEFY